MTDPPDHPLGLATLPEPLRARVEAELAPGERLLWAAQPNPKRPRGPKRARASNGVWLAGWVALGIIALVSILVLPARFESGFWFLILVFFVSGVTGILIGTHLVAEFAKEGSWRRRTALDLYALTDRRALIWTPVERSSAITVTQLLPGNVRAEHIERFEYPDGLGDLTLSFGSSNIRQVIFFGITEVRRVDELTRRVLTPPELIKPRPFTANPRVRHTLDDPDDLEEPF